MTANLVLDEEGRISIPGALRDELHLSPGDKWLLESNGDQITLTPLPIGNLVQEDGIWVVRSDSVRHLSITDLIDEDRDARYRQIAGFDR